jgi:hypothetical protein
MRFLPVWLAVALSAGVTLGLTLPAPPAALAGALAASFGLTLASFLRGDGARVVCSALGGLTLGAWTLASLDDSRARDPPLAAATRLPSPVEIAGVLQVDSVPADEEVRLRVGVSGAGLDARTETCRWAPRASKPCRRGAVARGPACREGQRQAPCVYR